MHDDVPVTSCLHLGNLLDHRRQCEEIGLLDCSFGLCVGHELFAKVFRVHHVLNPLLALHVFVVVATSISDSHVQTSVANHQAVLERVHGGHKTVGGI